MFLLFLCHSLNGYHNFLFCLWGLTTSYCRWWKLFTWTLSYCTFAILTESFTPSNSRVESEGKVISDGGLMHVEEKAMEVSWKDVLPDKSDMDERLVSELTTLVSFSMASLRLLSLAGTTVFGVFVVSVPLLDKLLCSAGLSGSKLSASCVFMLGSKSLDKSPAVKT